MTGPMFIVVLTLAAVVAVLVWVAWDHVRFNAVPEPESAPLGWLFEPTVELRPVRSHRKGWFS